jgi:LPS-assembly lipoprotein
MSWGERRLLAVRLLVVCALGALLGGCFQPMYASNNSIPGSPALHDKLAAIDLPSVKTSKTSDARLGVAVKNALAFNFYGAATGDSPTHRLEVTMSTTALSIIVDNTSGRPDIQDYGIDASYVLREIATNKAVVVGQTFSRVSFDIPGQEQRFARVRALRDAEDRATQQIADNISRRLASYFVAGS